MTEFLNLLLPWWWGPVSLITDIFISIIVLFFIVFLAIFLWKTIPRGRLFEGLAQKLWDFHPPVQPHIKQQLLENFERDTALKEAWNEFEYSLITRQRSENEEIVYKTDEASLFFSEHRLLEQHLNLRFWNSVPALLVGVGILGTFVGLVWGLIPFSGVDFDQTEKIKEAIQELLSGISTAFVSSVWGMLTSLLFTWLEKRGIGKVSRAIAKLQRALDRLFTLTTQEEIAFRQEDELAQQTQALKSFSTDLAEDLSSAMATKLAPSFDNLNAVVEELRRQKEESSTEAIEKLVKQFQTSLSGSARTQMETLAKTVSKASESLITFPEHMRHVEQSVSMLLQQQKTQIQEGNAQIANSQETLKKGKEMLEAMGTSLTSASQLIERINGLSARLMTSAAQLDSAGKNLTSAGKNLTQASDAFNEENKKYLSANRETIAELQRVLGQSRKLLNDFAQRFKTIDDGLQSIFAEIEEGLTTYSTTAKESINTYLSEFSEQLRSAATALAGSIEALNDGVEELTDTAERLTRGRGGR